MDGQRFDRFTRALASGASRRWIVRLLAGGVVAAGTAIARRTEGEAAQSACTVACAGLPGPQQAACKKACRECAGDIDRVCIERGPLGPARFVCCPAGTFCIGGEGFCCPNGTEPCFGPDGITCCPAGTICDFETGACLDECPGNSGCFGSTCAPGCFCVSSTEGNGACVSAEFANCDAPQCETSADCGGGVCVDASECCGALNLRVCFPPEAICEIGGGVGSQAFPGGWRQ